MLSTPNWLFSDDYKNAPEFIKLTKDGVYKKCSKSCTTKLTKFGEGNFSISYMKFMSKDKVVSFDKDQVYKLN